MRRSTLIAVTIGAATLWLTQWGKIQVMEAWVPAWTLKAPLLSSAVLDVFLAVVSLLPGFCAGLISGRRGILLGASTGLIGAITYSVIYALSQHPVASLGAWFWVVGLGLIVTCAAGGALGELLRSNNRWRGP